MIHLGVRLGDTVTLFEPLQTKSKEPMNLTLFELVRRKVSFQYSIMNLMIESRQSQVCILLTFYCYVLPTQQTASVVYTRIKREFLASQKRKLEDEKQKKYVHLHGRCMCATVFLCILLWTRCVHMQANQREFHSGEAFREKKKNDFYLRLRGCFSVWNSAYSFKR